MLCRYVWERMERRLRELPRPPRSDTEQPTWAIPSDGLPYLNAGVVSMKIVRTYPSGWNGYPVWVRVDLASIRFSLLTLDDALIEALKKLIP